MAFETQKDSVQIRVWALEQSIKANAGFSRVDVDKLIEEAQKIANFAMGDGK